MATDVTAQIVLNTSMHFTATAESGYSVSLDAPAPFGQGAGFTPMELILVGLAGCGAMDVLAVLRDKRQQVSHLDVRVRGQRRERLPSVFTTINLEYIVWGEDVSPEVVRYAIDLAATRYCPVWAMLEKSTTITSTFRVLSDAPVVVPCD